MELDFNPEAIFEEITGRKISPDERKKLNDFIRKYLIPSPSKEVDLSIIVTSALEAINRTGFDDKEFRKMIEVYNRNGSAISKPANLSPELIDRVRKACDKYHSENEDNTGLVRILKNNGFSCSRGYSDNIYVKKKSNKYDVLVLEGISTYLWGSHETKTKTGFVSLPPSEYDKFEKRIKRLEEIRDKHLDFPLDSEETTRWTFILDLVTAFIYVTAALSSKSWSWKTFGITMGATTSILPAISASHALVSKAASHYHINKIDRYFSDKSPYPHASSKDKYNPEIILNAIATR